MNPCAPCAPCTAVALLPPPEFVVRLAGPGAPPEAGHVLCELGEDHDGLHTALLWDEDVNKEAVWVRWNGCGAAGLVALPWCGVPDARGEDACGLFAGHPSAHDWNVMDPTLAAVDAVLAAEHPRLFPQEGGQDPL
ncbi:hypothetical protein ACIQPT_33865 [Streptomyces sp. NPDC091289]|uniref:hypothetical protein n=1 Tax=Streptomyces sp. NPDC091289 TaxID=3365989 RepID=UPI003824CD6C